MSFFQSICLVRVIRFSNYEIRIAKNTERDFIFGNCNANSHATIPWSSPIWFRFFHIRSFFYIRPFYKHETTLWSGERWKCCKHLVAVCFPLIPSQMMQPSCWLLVGLFVRLNVRVSWFVSRATTNESRTTNHARQSVAFQCYKACNNFTLSGFSVFVYCSFYNHVTLSGFFR